MPTIEEIEMEMQRRGLSKQPLSVSTTPSLSSIEKELQRRGVGVVTPPATSEFRQDYPRRRMISNIARPILETGGLIGGGVLGGGGALIAGQAGPQIATPEEIYTVPASAAAGAGLGHGMGSNLADRLDEFLGLTRKATLKQASKKALSDVGEGAMFELGGQAVGPALTLGGKSIWSVAEKMGLAGLFRRMKEAAPAITDKAMLNKSKDILKKHREMTPAMEKTAAETAEVTKSLGVKEPLTFAQQTGSKEAAMFEQSTASKDRELLGILAGKDARANQEAIAGVEKSFPAKAGPQDVIAAFEKEHVLLQQKATEAVAKSASDLERIRLASDPQNAGKAIKEALLAGRAIESNKVGALFDKLPQDIPLDAAAIKTVIRSMGADLKRYGGNKKSMPTEIINEIKAGLAKTSPRIKGVNIVQPEEQKATFSQLRNWRSQISKDKHQAETGSIPDWRLAARLGKLKNAVDDTLDQMLKLGPENHETIELYRKATGEFSSYAKKFREGTVGDVTKYGSKSSGGKVAYTDIPSRFFRNNSLDEADDLIAVLGKKDAGKLIKEYAEFDLISKTADAGAIKPQAALKWLATNKRVLDKYGLYDTLNRTVRTSEFSQEALVNLKAFQNTVAAKVFDVDPSSLMSSVLSGKGKTQSANIMRELVTAPGVKNNPAALEGLRNGFKDFFKAQMEKGGVDVLENPLMSVAKGKRILDEYMPAMKVLYRDKPEQLNALIDYHKFLRVIERNKAISFSGGSTTAEKLSGDKFKLFTGIAGDLAQLRALAKGKGLFFRSYLNLFKNILSAPGVYSQGQINALLTEAIHNPEVAKTIMDSTRPLTKISKNVLDKDLRHHLITLGIYGEENTRDFITRPLEAQ